jgi:hypothetical protein
MTVSKKGIKKEGNQANPVRKQKGIVQLVRKIPTYLHYNIDPLVHNYW